MGPQVFAFSFLFTVLTHACRPQEGMDRDIYYLPSNRSLANASYSCSLPDSLKKNPVMGEDELEQVAPGLGGEAVQDGLAGAGLGGLGKF